MAKCILTFPIRLDALKYLLLFLTSNLFISYIIVTIDIFVVVVVVVVIIIIIIIISSSSSSKYRIEQCIIL